MKKLTFALFTLAFVPSALSAQTVLVRVLDGESSLPVPGALTYLVDPAGTTVKNALTDERGRALFVGLTAGSFRVRVEMIGMATTETELFEVAEGTSVPQDIRLESSAIQLEGISVEAEGGRCRVRPGQEGLAVADVWDEARKALSAAAFTDEQGTYRYETMMYNRQLARDYTIVDESQSRRAGYMLSPFESRPAEDLVYNGFVQSEGREDLYFAPDASVLLSDAFLDTHCFRLADSSNQPGFIGLGFEPTGENARVPDIRGTMWLDRETAELQWLDFIYQYLDPDIQSDALGGRVDFRRMPNGTWIVPEWFIRMPAVTARYDLEGRRSVYNDGYLQTGGIVEEVREAGGRSLGQRVETGALEGTVVDSLGVLRRGVRVGVVGSNQEVYTNGDGEYSITGINPGRYQVQFIDPTLEAYGFVPPPVTRDVIRGEATPLDYHMPSIGDVLFDMCRDQARPEDSAILAGVVWDHRRRRVANANVTVSWITYAASGGGSTGIDLRDIDRELTDGFSSTTSSSGFFRFCGVPTDMRLSVRGTFEDMESAEYTLRIGVGNLAELQTIILEPR